MTLQDIKNLMKAEEPEPVLPYNDRTYQRPDDYTYKSYYYGRKGYCYLPSVKKPKSLRMRKVQPVNPFKQFKRNFPNAYRRR